MKKVIPLGLILVVVVVVVFMGFQTSRAGYESAPHTVVKVDGKFEVRDYPALTVVETSMSGSGADGSFGRLFNFISGANEGKQKIAMTTPVFMSGSDATRTMAFVMPANFKADQVPKPADAQVSVRELPAGRFAVFRFGGGRTANREAEALARLQKWMEDQGLAAISTQPVYGYFDPPWTPTFLRRNEVMLGTSGSQTP